MPSLHSYVAIVPPSCGALVPSGTIQFKILTVSTNGILLNYIDTSVINNVKGMPEQYLLVYLVLGQIEVLYSLNHTYTVYMKSMVKVNNKK